MIDRIHIATALAAARIQAVGGRPLTDDEMALCVYEAHALMGHEDRIRNGISVGDKLQKGLAAHGAAVVAHQRQERLDERWPRAPESLTEPSPRL